MTTKRKTRTAAPAETPDAEAPVVLRLPPELVKRIDALMPAVMSDTATATLLGRLSRSALYRLVLVEG
jgi:hypothetical protein